MALMNVVAKEKGVRMPDEIGRRKSGSDREIHLQLHLARMRRLRGSRHPFNYRDPPPF